MRLHAFLLVAVAALHARAATIPASQTEKKLTDAVPENFEKIPENTSSEQELIDQTNIIKDVENKLRVKPENIPVVVVEDIEPSLKADNEKDYSEKPSRPGPDLRNPGPPQRQEHETQNPEYFSHEPETILNFKQGINDAHIFLKQGLEGISDGIQNMIGNNEQILTIQKSIQSLREGFNAQINKLNGTIQTFLSSESSSTNQIALEQTKAIHQIEKGLITLRNDFNKGVKSFADGVKVVSFLKAENENSNQGSSSTAASQNPFLEMFSNFYSTAITSFQNMTQQANNFLRPPVLPNLGFGSTTPSVQSSDPQVTSATSAAPGNIWQNLQSQLNNFINPNQGQVQNDQPATSRPTGQFGSGVIAQAINSFTSLWTPKPAGQVPQAAQPAGQNAPTAQPAPASKPTLTEEKPSENPIKPEAKPEAQPEPAKPADASQAAAVTAAGPIRQILQNNPISQGIASAVQRLQNVNNPEKPREEEVKDQKSEEVVKKEDQSDGESKGGHYGGAQNSGDNNDSNVSRLEENEAETEDKLPEDQKMTEVQKEEDVKEHKTEEVVDKTE